MSPESTPEQPKEDPLQTRPLKRIRPLILAHPSNSSEVDIHLSYSQSFKVQNDDNDDTEIISSLQFNHSGNLLAFGDRGGKIQVLKRDPHLSSPTYDRHLTFQSHDPEFDYLKSIEIEEKVTQIEWLRANGPGDYLLSANDQTIKLWKIGEKMSREFSTSKNSKSLAIPRVVSTKSTPSTFLRRCYNNGHTFHINSVSLNSDGQTFASADDLRINLWDIDRTDASFVIVDMKPVSMENLCEVITTCSFHHSSCNILAYGTSRGSAKLCDLRTSSNCDKPLRHYRESSACQGYFSEVVVSVSDTQFSNSGTLLATRDFLTTRIWDTRMESTSLVTIPIHDHLKPHLITLYENDLIFDKFTVSWNHNDKHLLTGSYDDLFSISEPDCGKKRFRNSLFQNSNDLKEFRHHVLKPKRVVEGKRKDPLHDILIDDMDLWKRVLISQWHPKENVIAIASGSHVSLFNQKRLFCEHNF